MIHWHQGDTPIPSGTYALTKGIVSIGKKIAPAFKYDPCTADHTFADTFDLNRFGINGYVLHTPGHSPGGATTVIDDLVAIAGDSIIGTMPGSPFPPFADDVDELMRSWKKLLGYRLSDLPSGTRQASQQGAISSRI
ncbi:MAG: hypothetical protein MZV63_10595 [Marinilabiliales bacterium]|nr:hypothetical protein [Marinilabiliales bacterium]